MHKMILNLVILLLGISAGYGYGMWIFMAVSIFGKELSEATRQQVADFTFRLGLCAIIASGFLGLIIENGK